jgi:hypothetical protein
MRYSAFGLLVRAPIYYIIQLRPFSRHILDATNRVVRTPLLQNCYPPEIRPIQNSVSTQNKRGFMYNHRSGGLCDADGGIVIMTSNQLRLEIDPSIAGLVVSLR